MGLQSTDTLKKDDAGLYVRKDQVEFITQKVMMKFQGELLGRQIFNYHLPSGRYYERDNPPQFVFDKEEYELQNKQPSEAFVVDDLPLIMGRPKKKPKTIILQQRRNRRLCMVHKQLQEGVS